MHTSNAALGKLVSKARPCSAVMDRLMLHVQPYSSESSSSCRPLSVPHTSWYMPVQARGILVTHAYCEGNTRGVGAGTRHQQHHHAQGVRPLSAPCMSWRT